MNIIQLTPTGLVLDGATGLPTVTINSNPALPSISLGDLANVATLQIKDNPALISIAADLLAIDAGYLTISGNPLLTSISLNALSYVKRDITVTLNAALTTLNLPSLITCATESRHVFNTGSCPILANISCPNYLPTNGHVQQFRDCALTETTVDHLLSRCVANAGYVSGTVAFEGGTSSPPSAAGLADKAILVARGVIVTHN